MAIDNLSNTPVERIATGFEYSGVSLLLARYILVVYFSMKSLIIRTLTNSVSTSWNLALVQRSQSRIKRLTWPKIMIGPSVAEDKFRMYSLLTSFIQETRRTFRTMRGRKEGNTQVPNRTKEKR